MRRAQVGAVVEGVSKHAQCSEVGAANVSRGTVRQRVQSIDRIMVQRNVSTNVRCVSRISISLLLNFLIASRSIGECGFTHKVCGRNNIRTVCLCGSQSSPLLHAPRRIYCLCDFG